VSIDRIFIVFAAAVGIVIGMVLVVEPQSQSAAIPPYFWIFIAFALFEIAAIYLRHAGWGPPIAMRTRLIGFVLALALMIGVPLAAGVPLKLF